MCFAGLSMCGAAVLMLSMAGAARQVATSQTTPVTMTATIEAIDQKERMVTLKGPRGNSVDVKAPDEVEGFNRLKVGDQVSVTYLEAFALNLRKPGAAAPSTGPVITTERKDRFPGSATRSVQTVTATVTAIDPKAPSVTVKGPRGRLLTLSVGDAKQLQGVAAGDAVDLTYYESLIVKIARPEKP